MFTPAEDAAHLQLALEQARKSLSEGGIPIGAALVHKSGQILSVGHNCRIQKNSNTLHAEMDCLERFGRPAGSIRLLRESTMYTTLSPCIMCSATCVLYHIPRVVLGENETFTGGEALLRGEGREVVNLRSGECRDMMKTWVEGDGKRVWWEDIGMEGEEGGGGGGEDGLEMFG